MLVLISALCVALRLRARHFHSPGRGESVWRLRCEVNLRELKRGTRVRMYPPESAGHCRVIRETFSYPGFSMDIVRNRQTGRREVVAVALNPGRAERILATFDIHVLANGDGAQTHTKEKLPTLVRAAYLREETDVQVSAPITQEVLNQFVATKTTRTKLVEAIFDYCFEHIVQNANAPFSDAATTLSKGFGTTLGRARAMVALCRAGKVPARIVTGFVLDNAPRARPHVWVEAFSRKEWVAFDPENGFSETLPPNYLPVRQGGTSLLRATGGSFHTSFSIRRIFPVTELPSLRDGHFLDIIDLNRLPLGTQNALAILLLLPAGALITSVIRNVIGIRTFGTFTPSLIALSFIYSDWRTGLIVFTLVLGIGLGGRRVLGPLKLLMVPRLSIILTLVVLCITLAVSAFDYYGLTPGPRAVLLPIVILTLMIERWHITAEEDGPNVAFRRFSGTMLVAVCCYMVLRWKSLGQLALSFPEGQLFVAALLVCLGRYTGYRLTELWRFRRFMDAGGGEAPPS